MLFFETGIGVDALKESGLQTYSCSSCHVPEAGFRPGTYQGVGDGGIGFGIQGERRGRNLDYEEAEMDVQGIRPLSVLNAAFVQNTLWNGQFGAKHLNEGLEDVFGKYIESSEINHLGHRGMEVQNIEGLKLHRMHIDENVVTDLGYKELFDKAFPDFPLAERYTLKTGSFALSAYLRNLLTTEAPFQKWLKGDYGAMTDQQKRGAALFFDKANCYACHNNTNLGSNRFFCCRRQRS